MVGYRVLIIDDNQIFGSQVVAAFTDAGIGATWVARGSQALSLLDSEAARPQLVIIDLVRPASAGTWLLDRLHERAASGIRPPLALALVPVIGTLHDLPEGVEVQVKPIFPSQVVGSARRLLGLAPLSTPSTGGPAMGGPPRSGAAPASGAVAQHRLPPQQSPGISDELPTAALPTISSESIEPYEDSQDFGPADTLLAPSTIEELARAMTRSAPTGDDLLDSSMEVEPVSPGPDAETNPRLLRRSRTRRQFEALVRPEAARPEPTAAPPEEAAHLVSTIPLMRSPTPSSLADAARALAGDGAEGRTARGTSSDALTPVSDAPTLGGDLAIVPLIDIVSLLSRQRQTGVLTVTATPPAGEPTTFTMTWTRGRLDLCTATGTPEPGGDLRIGRFVLEAAALSHSQIDEIEARRQAQRGRRIAVPITDADAGATGGDDLLGLRLCKEGLLRPEELRQALCRQTAELLYAALRLPSGRFAFDHRQAQPRQAVEPELGGRLALDAEALLLEGSRRIRDHQFIDKDSEEGAVYVSTDPGLTGTLSSQNPLGRLGLSESEIIVLGLCNGRLSLAEIAKESHLPPLQVARTLARLQSLRLCRRRLPAVLAG